MIVFLYISEMFATRVASLLAVFDWRGTQKHRPRSSTVEFLTTRPYGGRWSSRGPEVWVRFPPWSIRRCRFKSCRGQPFCNFVMELKWFWVFRASNWNRRLALKDISLLKLNFLFHDFVCDSLALLMLMEKGKAQDHDYDPTNTMEGSPHIIIM